MGVVWKRFVVVVVVVVAIAGAGISPAPQAADADQAPAETPATTTRIFVPSLINEPPQVIFDDQDGTVCRNEAGLLTVEGSISLLPAGREALLQTTWQLLLPQDLRSQPVATQRGLVRDGDSFSIQVSWPGVRPGDQAVAIRVEGNLLDPATQTPIPGRRTSVDYTWRPALCGPTSTPTATATATPTSTPMVTPTPNPRCPATQVAQPVFQTAANIQLSPGTVEFALGDMNNDNVLDLVTVDPGNKKVDILFGTGTGTFNFQKGRTIENTPIDVALADLQGNGLLNIVTASANKSTVNELLNIPNIDFIPVMEHGVWYPPQAVALGNVIGDQRPDIVTVSKTDPYVAVLETNPDNLFGSMATYPIGSIQRDLALGDVDGDGLLDVVTASASSASINVLLNTGTSFDPPASYGVASRPNHVGLADLNNDGVLDIATADSGGSISILLGASKGRFSAATSFPAGPSGSGYEPAKVAFGDFNGDNLIDIATSDVSSGTVSVLLNSGSAVFCQKVSYATNGSETTTVTVNDLDRDGMLDIVALNKGDGTLAVLMGGPAAASIPPFQAAVNYAGPTETSAIASGDLNGDGSPDLVAIGRGISTLRNTGNGELTPVSNTLTVSAPAAGSGTLRNPGNGEPAPTSSIWPIKVVLEDVTNDGILDLLVTVGDSSFVSVYSGKSDGTFLYLSSILNNSSSRSLALSDLNGDGLKDLVAANPSSINVYLMTNARRGIWNFLTSYYRGPIDEVVDVALADVTGDGKPDLVVSNKGSNSVNVMAGDGTGFFDPLVTYAVAPSPGSLALADLNSDSMLDIAVTSSGQSAVSVLLSQGGGAFAAAQHYLVRGANPVGIALGDIDNNGSIDIVTGNWYGRNVSTLLNQGDGTFGKPSSYPSGGAQTGGPVLVDLNSDGKLDIAVPNQSNSTVSVLLQSP